MNNLQSLVRAERFFMNVRRRWKLGVSLLPLNVIGIGLLSYLQTEGSSLYHPVLAIVIVSGLFILLWLSSYIAVPLIKRQQIKLVTKSRTSATAKKREQTRVSSSNMLPLYQKIRAWINLKELQDTSDFCFAESDVTYLRLQWLGSFTPSAGQKKEMMIPLKPGDYSYGAMTEYDRMNESCVLTFKKVQASGRERLFACWTPPNAGAEEVRNAETIELNKNVPVVLAYGLEQTMADGATLAADEYLCIITWIGGDL